MLALILSIVTMVTALVSAAAVGASIEREKEAGVLITGAVLTTLLAILSIFLAAIATF